MNDFLHIIIPPTDTRKPIRKKPGRPYSPGSYRAAAEYAGVSTPHVYNFLHGSRDASDTTRQRLRRWASRAEVRASGDPAAQLAAQL